MSTTLYTTSPDQGLKRSVEALATARPLLVDVAAAGDLIANLGPGVALHAGPPIEPQRMCAPMRAALGIALTLEGISPDPAQALNLVDDGEIELITNHDAGGVGPMVGVLTSSMPVWVAHDEITGKTAWCGLNEGSGRVMRYGGDGPEVTDRLTWMRDVLAPELARALKEVGPIDLIDLQANALAVGDECHHRTQIGTNLLLTRLGQGADRLDPSVEQFIAGNSQFFLNVAMVSAKLALDCASDIAGSPLVTAIARNGVEVGIRLSGTGNAWFTGPAGLPDPANLSAGFGPADMCRDLGDSAIVETYGLGALAVAASPSAAESVGLAPAESIAITKRLRQIAAGSHPDLKLPGPGQTVVESILGINARAVVDTGILPPVHTGIAHRQPGVGQIGGGVTHPPMEAFIAAINALDAGEAVTATKPTTELAS